MLAKFRQYHTILGIRGLLPAILGKAIGRSLPVQAAPPGVAHPVTLRVPSTDVESFNQVFLRREYEFAVRFEPGVILDAGANIGLAAVYFANRYPLARIIAVEPEESNLRVLRRNIRPYPNITCLSGAVWNRNETIELVDPGLGKWGFMTRERGDRGEAAGRPIQQVRGMTMDAIMAEAGVERIDILKMDIEGAEREVLQDCRAWIGKMDAVIVELHDRLKPGCGEVFSAAAAGFDYQWRQGENAVAARETGCLIPASGM